MHSARYLSLLALVLVVVSAACASRSRVVEHYQKDGLEFSHYSDWTVVKDAPVKGKPDVRAIHIEGPDDAVVSLICAPAGNPQTVAEFAAAVADQRGAAIEEKLSLGPVKAGQVSKGTSAPTTGKVAGQARPGILHQFSIDLLGTQVPHEARFYEVNGSRYKVMIMTQVAAENAMAARPAAELILSTLTIEGMQ